MSFSDLMQEYCARCGWKVGDLTEDRLRIAFSMASGRPQTLHVAAFDDTLEFSVQSELRLDLESEIPHRISTDLMRKSCTNKVGMWVIQEIRGKFVYSLMHNCRMGELTAEGFEGVVEALVDSMDRFNAAIEQLAGWRATPARPVNPADGAVLRGLPAREPAARISGELGRAVVRGAGQKLGTVAAGVLLSLLLS